MNSRSRVRNVRYRRSASLRRFIRAARPGGFRAFQLGCDRRLLPIPHGEQRPDHHGLDELQDLLAVRVVRPELRALARVEPALEQRPEDRRVDLRPVEVRRCQHRLDVRPLQRQRSVVVEQSAVEPGHRLEADPAARRHHLEELAGELREPLRSRMRMPQHPRERARATARHRRRTWRTPSGRRSAPPPAGRGRAPAATAPPTRTTPRRAPSALAASPPAAAARGRRTPT